MPAISTDTTVALSPADIQVSKVMTQALCIPHFGYTHSVDMTRLGELRQKINSSPLAVHL